jgi:hypothetical protein
VAAAAAAVSLTTIALLVLSGVSLLPRATTVAVTSATPTPSVVRAALASSPAQVVIVSTLDSPALASWSRAGDLAWTAGTPYDATCGRPDAGTPALAATRAYALGGRQVVVTLSAYTAGQGAVAFAGWTTLLGSCGHGVARYAASTPTTDALTAWVSPAAGRTGAASLMWRRGDVVASVSTTGVSPAGLAPAAAQVDTALLTAMGGRCAVVGSTLADAARSPYIGREAFTGLTVPVMVSVSASPTPRPPPGVTPVPTTYSPDPLPSVSFPSRPEDPVWPIDLPAAVPSPVQPVQPTQPPSVIAVPSRIDDAVGPGCGWAFTGQVKPAFDAATEAVQAESRAQQAQVDLVTGQQRWQGDLVGYWSAVPDYAQQAQAFTAYAAAVDAVARSWDAITGERNAYLAAVAAYDLALTARTTFLDEQATARAGYDAAVAACGLVGTPLPSDTAVPSDLPTPTDTATPSASSACPPLVPDILTQSPPPVPPAPTPPPDPRPPTAR